MMAVKQSEKPTQKIIVAIDGPAGAGKSTIARSLANRFGLLNLETGAMYRAFALKVLRMGLALDDADVLARIAEETTLTLDPVAEGNRVLLDGEDVTGLVRNQMVTDAASKVSVLSPIRAWMVRQQQQLGAHGGVVMEGRDIGTVVFPQAEVKIFVDASAEVRGARRHEQLGKNPTQTLEEVVADLKARDTRDRNRADSPLKAAEDSVILDSTQLTLEETLEAAAQIVADYLAKHP